MNNSQICGSYEKQSVVVHAINLDHVIPYYNPSNIPFSYNQSTRKSFNRGTPKKLALKSRNSGTNNNSEHQSGSLTSGKDHQSSPSSLSFEMIDESLEETPPLQTSSRKSSYAFENLAKSRESCLYSLPPDNYSNEYVDDFPNQLPSNEENLYFDNNYSNDLDYYPERIIEPEPEEFPVNNAQQPDYAPKMDLQQNSSVMNAPKLNKSKPIAIQRKTASIQHTNTKSSLSQAKKFSSSTIDLHSIDDSNVTTFGAAKKGFSSRSGSPTRNYTSFGSNNNKIKRTDAPKESIHARNNRKITVQILHKPPPRSKTSLDLRASSAMSHHSIASGSSSIISVSNQSKHFPSTTNLNGHGHSSAEENAEISVLTAYHERVYQQLSTRHATLTIIRNSTR